MSRNHKNKLGFIDPTVAGIDIGSKLIHVSIPKQNGKVSVVEYETTTPDLERIVHDLHRAGVTTAVMEATGVYWIPLYETIESSKYPIQPVLVDAKSVKNVPGRKSDVLDCQWIQTLYSNGLLRAAFRPGKEYLTLRSLVRTRENIIQNRQQALQHIEKSLQLMNIKLSSAVSDIAGVSGMKIIRAIVSGERDANILAGLRNSGCKSSIDKFVRALTGNFQDEHLFNLKLALEQYDFSLKQMEECDEYIRIEVMKLPTVTTDPLPERDKDLKDNGKYKKAAKPRKNKFSFDLRTLLWQKSGVDLTSIPGLESGTALTIFAELGGVNFDSFKSEKEFCSWLKLCPGNNISGGMRRKCKYQPCLNRITQALRLSSMSCKRSKTALGAFIRRLCGRTDKRKGIKAGAHKLAKILYSMCKNGMNYFEKGEAYVEKKYREKVLKRLQKQAKDMGYVLVANPS